MRIYLSGWQASTKERERAVVKAGVIDHRCFSFASIQKIPGLPYHLPHIQGSYDVCVKHKVGIMLDSGVFGYRSYKRYLEKTGKPVKLPTEEQFVRQYVDYCLANQSKWNFCVTVDFVENAAEILKRHKQLEKMGIRPMPVFHGDSSIDYLDCYADMGYDWVAIGALPRFKKKPKTLRRYLETCFNRADKLGMKLHGLALTASWQMLDFPFFSVDSSSWSRVAGYGGLMRFSEETGRLSILHVSTRDAAETGSVKQNKHAMKLLERTLNDEGFDLQKLQEDFVARHVYNAKTMQQLAAFATKKHAAGGGKWDLLL